MKLLFTILFILLSGCSTMSEYQVGCYDGLDQAFNIVYNDSATKEQNYELENNVENMKLMVCHHVNAKMRMRYDNK